LNEISQKLPRVGQNRAMSRWLAYPALVIAKMASMEPGEGSFSRACSATRPETHLPLDRYGSTQTAEVHRQPTQRLPSIGGPMR
jgi:hypothetical protein